ncbi:hypothetical protein ACYOEI_35035, partial [Singulisphaera rosea]
MGPSNLEEGGERILGRLRDRPRGAVARPAASKVCRGKGDRIDPFEGSPLPVPGFSRAARG